MQEESKMGTSSLAHDFSKPFAVVLRDAEGIIQDLPGEEWKEKIENADPRLRSLLKSILRVPAYLSVFQIISNPESVSYGRRCPRSVCDAFSRMANLFEPLALEKKVILEIESVSKLEPPCYDSFDALCVVLLDTAIRLSSPRKKVLIRITDSERKLVNVSVASLGVVPDAIRASPSIMPDPIHIFRNSLGRFLFAANMVAKAHRFEIRYKCSRMAKKSRTGWNVFWFEVPC